MAEIEIGLHPPTSAPGPDRARRRPVARRMPIQQVRVGRPPDSRTVVRARSPTAATVRVGCDHATLRTAAPPSRAGRATQHRGRGDAREVPGRARRPGRGRHLGGAQPCRPVRRSRCWPGLLLEADDDGVLRLSSFDYEVSARVRSPPTSPTAARSSSPAGCSPTSPAILPGKPVDVATDGSKVSLTCGASRFTLLTMPVDEYPTLPGDARRLRAPSPAMSSPRPSPR